MIFCQKRSLCQNNIHPWTTFPLRNTTNLGAVPWPPENFQEEKIHFLEDQWTFMQSLSNEVLWGIFI